MNTPFPLSGELMLTIFTVVTATGVSMFLILLFVDIRRKKRMLGQQKMIAEAESALLRERLETAGKELNLTGSFSRDPERLPGPVFRGCGAGHASCR